jgi:redox-sensitive bicupin YhaK (pirin superfamily)
LRPCREIDDAVDSPNNRENRHSAGLRSSHQTLVGGEVSGAVLNAGSEITYTFQPGDAAYLVPATRQIQVNDKRIQSREGLVIREESVITINALEDSEVVLIVTAA